MNPPKPSQNPSLSQSAQGIALTSITPSTKSQQPLAYHLLHDEESSTRTTSLASSQQIPNQEAPTRLPANQNMINNPNQPLTISPDLTELKYHELHLAGHPGWWSPVKGILSLFVLMIFVVPFILLTLFEIYYALTGESENRLFESNGITPAQLLYMNLALASLIPISYFLNYRFHGLSPGWMNSVERRIRWCWLFVCLGLSIGSIIAAGIVISMFIPVEQNNTENTQGAQDTQYTENTQTEPNGSPSSTAIQYAIIVLFLTPLQAAGEEFAFRGYLTQAFSGLFSKRWRWMGILIPAILFAMAHGFDQTFPMVFDRFLFGIVTGVLVIMTGGLEAGIAMHVVNNVLIFTVAVAADSLDQTMETGSAMESQWWIMMVISILKWAIYVVLILLLAPSHYLQTKVWKAVVRGEILPIQGVPVFAGMPQQMNPKSRAQSNYVMNLPKPSQNPSVPQSGQGIALTSITPSTKSQKPPSYYSLQDEDSSTKTNSTKYFQQIPNQESLANQHIINDPNQPLTLSSDSTELEYHELHLAGHHGWWPSVKGILALFALYAVIVPLIILSLFGIYYNFTGESENRRSKSNGITPAVMLSTKLLLASLIPISYFLNSHFHGLRPGWISSVESRIRWCWLFVCLGLSIGSMIATIIAASLLIPNEKNDTEPNGSPSSKAIQYALIIFFLTPLQAAGEEFAFRGYLTQAFSALFSKRWRWMGILIPAILFTMAHGFNQTFLMVFDRFLFGIVAGVLVILTGGLETGIAMHVINNMWAFTGALMSDELDQVKTRSAMESQWLDAIAVNILRWTIYVVLVLLLAPRHQLQTKVWNAEVRGEILPTQRDLLRRW